MKTFEQYIGEARQNYIFGGTDDRNTDTPKTFDELIEGDDIYMCYINHDEIEYAKVYTFIRIDKNCHGNYTSDIIYKTNKTGSSCHNFPNHDIDSPMTIEKYAYFHGGASAYIVTTDEKLMLDEIEKLTGKKNVKIEDSRVKL